MRSKKKRVWMELMLCLSLVLLSGCRYRSINMDEEMDSGNSGNPVIEKEDKVEANQIPLRDKDILYEEDEEDSVVTMYLTVRKGNSLEGTDHTWAEVNDYSAYYYDENEIERYKTEAILQIGNEDGPIAGEFGYSANVANATVQIRGQTSSMNAQKNYKVRIKDNKGTWRGQQTINLNKHQTDGLRFRNKLGFDLLKGIPQIISLRTQFVHLYVKDETAGGDTKFVDYGLYTQVEQLNKKALRAREMDENAHLYKINSCEFYRYEDSIKLANDPDFNDKEFERILECKGSVDHRKLIQMLEDVNDYSISPNELIEKHFNLENITYWMAFQILTANIDTQNRNFFIYSPQNLDTWYILPWDLDGAFRKKENEEIRFKDGGGWEIGVSNYWGNVLFQRCLKSEAFRKSLDETILEMKEYLTKERIQGLVDLYRPVVESYAFSLPDIQHESLTREQYDLVASTLSEQVDICYDNYVKSLQNPLPFYIGVPTIEGNRIRVNWDVSYDFQQQDITYKMEIARDYAMNDVVETYTGIWPETEINLLEPGQYFVRVLSKDSDGNEQYAFDYYVTENGKEYGIKCFYVLEDGTIGEDVYEE